MIKLKESDKDGKMTRLKSLIVFDQINSDLHALAAKNDIRILSVE